MIQMEAFLAHHWVTDLSLETVQVTCLYLGSIEGFAMACFPHQILFSEHQNSNRDLLGYEHWCWHHDDVLYRSADKIFPCWLTLINYSA